MPDTTEPPRRFRLSRARGSRLPEGALSVARPSRWGNPWVAEVVDGRPGGGWRCRDARGGQVIPARDRAEAHDLAVSHFRAWICADPATVEAVRAELRGKALMCWCPLALPCHADVLIEVANG